jgi:hypothetical protein
MGTLSSVGWLMDRLLKWTYSLSNPDSLDNMIRQYVMSFGVRSLANSFRWGLIDSSSFGISLSQGYADN